MLMGGKGKREAESSDSGQRSGSKGRRSQKTDTEEKLMGEGRPGGEIDTNTAREKKFDKESG